MSPHPHDHKGPPSCRNCGCPVPEERRYLPGGYCSIDCIQDHVEKTIAHHEGPPLSTPQELEAKIKAMDERIKILESRGRTSERLIHETMGALAHLYTSLGTPFPESPVNDLMSGTLHEK